LEIPTTTTDKEYGPIVGGKDGFRISNNTVTCTLEHNSLVFDGEVASSHRKHFPCDSEQTTLNDYEVFRLYFD